MIDTTEMKEKWYQAGRKCGMHEAANLLEKTKLEVEDDGKKYAMLLDEWIKRIREEAEEIRENR